MSERNRFFGGGCVPIRIGDEITVKDFRGRVVEVGMRTTSLRTEDDLQVLIPNAVVLAEVVVNRSTYPAAATPGRTPDREP